MGIRLYQKGMHTFYYQVMGGDYCFIEKKKGVIEVDRMHLVSRP